MELRLATQEDLNKVRDAVEQERIQYITVELLQSDLNYRRLYVVVNNGIILATVSLVPDMQYGYTAIKRLHVCDKRYIRQGIGRFAVHEITKLVHGRVGATPWEDNVAMRHLLESEGFELKYVFDIKWCFYCKTV